MVRKGFSKGLFAALKKGKRMFYDAPFDSLPKDVKRGYHRKAMESGADSVFLAPFNMFGSTKMKKRMAKHLSVPSTKLDTALGAAIGKVTPLKKMFTIKEQVPVSIGPNKLYQEVNRPSALAPATKVMDVAIPFAGAMAIDDALRKASERKKKRNMATVTLEKTAAIKLAEDMIRLNHEVVKLAQANSDLEKTSRAQKLIYKQASLGMIEMPTTYEELLEKAAALATEDLDVVEKALSYRLGDVGMGKLASGSAPSTSTPEGNFVASILDTDEY